MTHPHRLRLRLLAAAVLVAMPWPALAQHAPAASATAAPASAAAPFTLDAVMSAPFANGLIASPRGDAVAWVFEAGGARNVWVAAAPDFRGRPLTAYATDDGQEIGDLAFTPDGRAVVYVRGAGPNRAGERPNPALIPGGAEEAIWVAPLAPSGAAGAAGAAPRKLAEGAQPAVAPNGKSVAFVRGGQVWTVPIDSGAPTQLGRTRGAARTLRWSPDGRQLAFVSARDRHAIVGVWDVAARSYRWLDASADEDRAPAWSPDGRRIAFIRTPTRNDEMIFVPERAGAPWSIRVVDVATGAAHEAWRARAGRGSVFRNVDADDQLWWTPGDRIVFPWEGDGWTHLYAVATDGGGSAPATLLTPGDFEVEHVARVAGADSSADVYYSSNQGDIDRRHVWRVRASGGAAPTAVTRGTAIEWSPAPLATGAVVVLHSDARHPARPAIVERDGALRDLAPEAMPADFPAASLVEPTAVRLVASDGVVSHAQLFLPPNGTGGRHAALIFVHGGSRRQMLLGFHYMTYYDKSYRFNQYLASRGYVVLSLNYRSGIGYGFDFREARDYGAAGASEYRDVLAAARWLRGRADVDPTRVGMWGGSYGGYLTAMGLARNSDLFAAGVDMHGVHDWNEGIRTFVPSYDSTHYATRAALAWRSSPIASVRGWRSPVLLIHGDDDRNVAFTQTTLLLEALRAQGTPVETLVFPDEIHDFLLHRSWRAAYAATADFFDRTLGPKRHATAAVH